MAVELRAILFDVGGVLVVSGEAKGRRRWEHRLGLPAGYLDRALADAIGPGWRGGRAEDDIWARFRSSLPVTDPEFAVLRRDMFAHEHLDPTLAELLGRARPAFRLGIVTNNGPTARQDLQRRFGLCDMVDCLVVSAEEGVEKPEAAIFETVARRLGVSPEACIFVDDRADNVAGAEAVGMTGLVHQSSADTVDRLRRLCLL